MHIFKQEETTKSPKQKCFEEACRLDNEIKITINNKANGQMIVSDKACELAYVVTQALL